MQENTWEKKLTSDMQRVLTPVHPSDSFRQHLRNNLQLAGQQQSAQRALRFQQPAHVNYWVIGAATLGVAVAAGSMIAWAIRSRMLFH